jgi:hypothetical protein
MAQNRAPALTKTNASYCDIFGALLCRKSSSAASEICAVGTTAVVTATGPTIIGCATQSANIGLLSSPPACLIGLFGSLAAQAFCIYRSQNEEEQAVDEAINFAKARL